MYVEPFWRIMVVAGEVLGTTRVTQRISSFLTRWSLPGRFARTSCTSFVRMPLSSSFQILPTLFESQGLVIGEAMAFGLPVIASRIRPVEDVVSLEKESAILVDPNNTGEIGDNVTFPPKTVAR